MADTNPVLIYRPLWAGICVISSTVRSRGTIGCFADDDNGGTWLITARHVFSNAAVAPDVGVSVHQPDDFLGPVPINELGQWRLDTTGEVIAAKMAKKVQLVRAWPGLGAWKHVAAPQQGSVVAKAGIATGVTRGRITNVDERGFNVEHLPDLPNLYQTNVGGDSGSAWMDPTTGALIGIHIGEQAGGVASVRRADTALASMGLVIASAAITPRAVNSP